MRCVLPAEPAVLAQLETLGRLLLVLRRAVVPTLAVGARERNDVAHFRILVGFGRRALGVGPYLTPRVQSPEPVSRSYAMISVIVPAPTVRPPSRIANRAPFSIATGVISSAVIDVLSPGI